MGTILRGDPPIVISETGYAQGFGSARWKQVSGLTLDERRVVRGNRGILVIVNCPPDGGNRGVTVRRVVVNHYNNSFKHTVPDEDTLVRLRAAGIEIDY